MTQVNTTYLQVNPQAASQGNIAGMAMAILGQVEGTILKATQKLNSVSQEMLKGSYSTAVSVAKTEQIQGNVQAVGSGITAAAGAYQGCSQATELGSYSKESSALSNKMDALQEKDGITDIGEGAQLGNGSLNETNLEKNTTEIDSLKRQQKTLGKEHEGNMQKMATNFQALKAASEGLTAFANSPFKAEQTKFQAAQGILQAGGKSVDQAEANGFSSTQAINQAISRAYDAQAAVRAA